MSKFRTGLKWLIAFELFLLPALVGAYAQGYLTPIGPQPYTGVPLGPSGTGVPGTGGDYLPWNGQQRQAVQRTVALTDSSGNFAVTWNTAFVSATPTVVVEAGNPGGTQPISCNWQTRSSTGVTGKCWQAGTPLISLAVLPINVNVFGATPATNTPISVIMAEPTQ